jgi:hypothetical protein
MRRVVFPWFSPIYGPIRRLKLPFRLVAAPDCLGKTLPLFAFAFAFAFA